MNRVYRVEVNRDNKSACLCEKCGQAFAAIKVPRHECDGTPMFAPPDVRKAMVNMKTRNQ